MVIQGVDLLLQGFRTLLSSHCGKDGLPITEEQRVAKIADLYEFLKEETGQDFGHDVDKWYAWFKESSYPEGNYGQKQ